MKPRKPDREFSTSSSFEVNIPVTRLDYGRRQGSLAAAVWCFVAAAVLGLVWLLSGCDSSELELDADQAELDAAGDVAELDAAPCGLADHACCGGEGGTCDAGLACEHEGGERWECNPCGVAGQPCCPSPTFPVCDRGYACALTIGVCVAVAP